jgi:DDE family transposase/uncharacterized protein DUF4372
VNVFRPCHTTGMKSKNKPAKSKLTILRQICQLIPGYLTTKLAREHGIESRSFNPWSHVVAMLYAQLAQAMSLNDVCDGLAISENALKEIRGAQVPSRNGLSHSNRQRDATMAESLYWAVAEHLCSTHDRFALEHGAKNFAYRFKRPIYLVDATTIQLVANCMDWARHRRRKAAVKCHLSLDLQTFLPSFVIIDTAREHEATRARQLCARLREGEIAVFDKGYMDLEHLNDLQARGVYWVTRAKDNTAYQVMEAFQHSGENIVGDCVIQLKHYNSKMAYPGKLRLVCAKVEVDGKEQMMEFITNHLEWSASSVADLYRCRWQIEVFFKSLKQNLQIGSILGYNANAVRWQIWMGLLVHLLMRFLKWKSHWQSHFGRLFTVVRCALWNRWDLESCLRFYGTAGSKRRMRTNLRQAYLPGFI